MQWLETTSTLDYAVDKVQVWEGTVTVHISRSGAAAMPVDVCVRCRDGSVEVQRWPGAAEQGQLIFLTEGRRVDSVELDPQHWLLDVNRRNNSW